MSRKSQIWTMDLIVGVVIFFASVTVFFMLTRNIGSIDNTGLEARYNNLILVSDTLISAGAPSNWSKDLIWDTYVRSDLDENLGNTNEIKLVYSDVASFWGGLMRFKIDCSDAPYAGAVLNMKLDANNLDGPPDGFSVSTHRILETYIWEESQVIFSTMPVDGVDYDAAMMGIHAFDNTMPLDLYQWDVAAAVNTYCALGLTDVSIFLKTDLEIGNVGLEDYLEFNSKESNKNIPFISSGGKVLLNTDEVQEFGLTDGNHRIDIVKFLALNSLDYQTLKVKLKTGHDILIFFEDRDGNLIKFNDIEYTGKSGVTKDNIMTIEEPDNLVSTKRFLIHNSEIIAMVVYLWD